MGLTTARYAIDLRAYPNEEILVTHGDFPSEHIVLVYKSLFVARLSYDQGKILLDSLADNLNRLNGGGK